ncbi:MAG: FliM/FliN family flagellar motor switch protein [Planctomycetes bacterium]|nr:FliM/FliN family flagellar motor switch protein [Planctomycetota bacterium]
MPDILSADELNDLLSACADTEVSEGSSSDPIEKTVAPYDFTRPTRLSRAQVRQLQRLYESALEGLTGALSESLRTPIEANVLGVKAVTFGSFTNLLPTPTYVNVFKIEPYGYRGILAMDIPFCLALVDRLLGGHGHTTEKPRNLTGIEVSVIDWPVTLILEQLQKCWRSDTNIQFASESIRMDLNFVQVIHTAETVLRVTFALAGEIGSGEAHFCVPFAALERAKCLERLREEALGSGRPPVEQELQQARANLKKAYLGITAQLGEAVLTVGEVIGLKPGQVIKLNTRVAEPIPVKVGDRTKFLAKPGLRARSNAVQIQQVLEDS